MTGPAPPAFYSLLPPLLLHGDGLLAPHDLWGAWSADWGVVVPLGLTAFLYARGSARLGRRGRTTLGAHHRAAVAFWSGWAVLVLALVSPLHRLGEVLFSAHMAQHELLMAVAAPLLVLGRPLVPGLWALPVAWRRRLAAWARTRPVGALWATLTRPGPAATLHGVVILAWHAPALYQRTLTSDAFHAAQHASFLGSALLFWWALIHGRGARGRYGLAVLYLFITSIYTGGLGALLAVADRVWYPAYAATTSAWGLTPLEDQQLAGLVMWVPAGLVYLVAALAFVVAWMRESEARATV